MNTLGIIGFGRFGQLAAAHLRRDLAIVAHDAGDIADAAAALGVTVGSLEAAAACDVVMLAVPVQELQAVVERIAPLVRPGALVMDVASVKLLPAEWMRRALPETVSIVATHPLFGPQSAKAGLAGQPLVICPVRGKEYAMVARFGRRLGLQIRVTTPEEHDREMAYVQALTHLVGRALVNIKVPDELLKTNSYQHLLDLCGLIRDDSHQLFVAIQKLNPFASEVTRAFLGEAEHLLAEADSSSTAARPDIRLVNSAH